ncbi:MULTISPECIES: hypothetical protein [Myxococcus]|uniref:hypothetical protein n=1 Tax=Myxococcus TaxID=32 RepID=UPI00112EC8AC|nr:MULTISPECIES: hypothetical protein [Myxococcus]WAM29180.1 hypothetical protein OZ403_14065 [Myxococcus sp. NMCA1]
MPVRTVGIPVVVARGGTGGVTPVGRATGVPWGRGGGVGALAAGDDGIVPGVTGPGTAAVTRGTAGRAGVAGVSGVAPGGLPALGSEGSDIGVVESRPYCAAAGRSLLLWPASRVFRLA